jgi:hypothetical protein
MRKFAALASALLGAAFSITPASAANTVCEEDGVARLCATGRAVQNVTAIDYDVTQQDGPGSYQIYYVDLENNFTSPRASVGPLSYQQHATGTLYGEPQHCFRVVLTSSSGTTLDVAPVCE